MSTASAESASPGREIDLPLADRVQPLVGAAEWEPVLQRFAAATGLTLVLCDDSGEPLSPPWVGNPLGELLVRCGAWSEGGCLGDSARSAVVRCLRDEAAHLATAGILSFAAIPVSGGDGFRGCLLAGWIFTDFPEPVSTDRFARDLGLPFLDLWQVVRQVSPVGSERLRMYADLLEIVAVEIAGRRTREARHHEEMTSLLEREQRLEEESRAKDQFFALASHELRNPLMPVLGWIPLVRTYYERNEVDEARKGLDIIERNVRQQLHLIGEMLDLSRLLVGKVVLEPENVEPANAVREALESASAALQDRRLSLAMELQDHLPPVYVDRKRLLQCLSNLAANAIKFTPDGGRIVIGAHVRSGAVEFHVADTGIGLRPEELQSIFKPFSQGEEGRAGRFGGLGIGLSVVRNLVELHGGQVRAESAGPGQGATFFITLPASRAAGMPARPAVSESVS